MDYTKGRPCRPEIPLAEAPYCKLYGSVDPVYRSSTSRVEASTSYKSSMSPFLCDRGLRKEMVVLNFLAEAIFDG
jgi:hypothetical protein